MSTNITNVTDSYKQAFLNETTEKQRAEAPATETQENKTSRLQDDKVSISGASKDLQTAEEAVSSSPDTRPEKVNELKQAVASGQYGVDAGIVAEKMIGTILSDMG